MPFTVAEKVTGWPNVLGFGVEANVVVSVVEATFCVNDVLLPENKRVCWHIGGNDGMAASSE